MKLKTKKNSDFIRVFEPYIDIKDSIKVFNSVRKKEISGTSKTVQDFEEITSNFFDRKHSVAVANGSCALDLALQALNLSPDDEIIIPSFTIISCLSAVLRSGAKPVFCDVNPSTWNADLDHIKKVLSKKTKGILMVHTYGLASNAIEIEKFCLENNLMLIEDAAEAHGQFIKNRKCGSFGNISILSFYANKHITTGEGGCVLTNDTNLFEKVTQMRNLDFKKNPRFVHDNLYWNYRMSAIQASLGINQFKKINYIINHKKEQGQIYLNLFNDYQDKLQLPLSQTNLCENNFWVFGLVAKSEKLKTKITEGLLKKGIETRPFFFPLHKQPVIKKLNLNNTNLEISEYLGSNGFYIPTGPHINKKTQELIANEVISFL